MRALVFDASIPRYMAGKVLGALYRPVLWSGLSCVRVAEVPEPVLPGEEWVRVRMTYGGICGSDLNTILLHESPTGSALTSFPFVLGHENVGIVEEVGREAREVMVGDRVVVEPLLPCPVRGYAAAPCPACIAGEFNLCRRFTEGPLASGVMMGFCRDTGGSWARSVVAHRWQIHRLPPSVSDENALVSEPVASALHPVRRPRPGDGETVLVIGGGMIGQCTIAALRAVGSRARILALAKYRFQGEMAAQLGADQVVYLTRDFSHYGVVADATGARVLRPILGPPLLSGGVDVTFECVGRASGLNDALRLTRQGGRVVVVGLAAMPRGIDWSPICLKELQISGSVAYATEAVDGRRVRTMAYALELMARGAVNVGHLVTHRFTPQEYAEAIETALGKSRGSVFKVAFVHH
ncbi:MAG: alcohol dehydrogenase catalytic domain-containing protein [Armatimonadetes bacterium]|nr:alcohol dehydrogenase catalytic domain-containing protein [Armatimonadota bacterium]